MIPTLGRKSGWTVLYGAALAASFCPITLQLLFATVAIGILGMAHGASDLAVVRPGKKALFLCCYVALMAVCLLGWQVYPASALPVFLLASAIHFTIEEPPEGGWLIRLALGVGLITIPAVFYRQDTAVLLSYAGFSPHFLEGFMRAMQGIGLLCVALLLVAALPKKEYQTVAGALSLLFFPPLIGFSLGFLILHAFPQTDERRCALRCKNYYDYLGSTWPILGGALLFSFLTVIFFLPAAQNTVRTLFTLLTALALPHLLITPLFELNRKN